MKKTVFCKILEVPDFFWTWNFQGMFLTFHSTISESLNKILRQKIYQKKINIKKYSFSQIFEWSWIFFEKPSREFRALIVRNFHAKNHVTTMYQTRENRVCPKAARACPNPRTLNILRTGFFVKAVYVSCPCSKELSCKKSRKSLERFLRKTFNY